MISASDFLKNVHSLRNQTKKEIQNFLGNGVMILKMTQLSKDKFDSFVLEMTPSIESMTY